MKKAIILDLDNTIYGVPTIGKELFAPLFRIIRESGEHSDYFDAISNDIMRKPFQVVAADHNFSNELAQQGFELLKNITYEGTIEPFSDYKEVGKLPVEKFLVTTGFPLLQQSKIRRMRIEEDFKEIHIVDPATSDKTKKDVFADILQRNGYSTGEVLVTGDDLQSEIKAAQDLGIDVVVYDKYNIHPGITLPRITDFGQLTEFI